MFVDILLASWWHVARARRGGPRRGRIRLSAAICRPRTRAGRACNQPRSANAIHTLNSGRCAAHPDGDPDQRQPAPPPPFRRRPQGAPPVSNRRTTARDLAQIAIFAALIAALGLPGTITVGSTGVPITLQT